MPAQCDDPLGAQPLGRQHGGEPDRAITDDGYHRPFSHAGADRGMVPGRHHVGEGEQRLEDLVGMTMARHRTNVLPASGTRTASP